MFLVRTMKNRLRWKKVRSEFPKDFIAQAALRLGRLYWLALRTSGNAMSRNGTAPWRLHRSAGRNRKDDWQGVRDRIAALRRTGSAFAGVTTVSEVAMVHRSNAGFSRSKETGARNAKVRHPRESGDPDRFTVL